MSKTLYTVSEIAKLAGVSLRTVRFYDEKELLRPVSYSETGYRYYNRDSLIQLQRILMLRYLGFSLEQIKEILHSDTSLDTQLLQQKRLLQKKRQHLDELIETIELTEGSQGENQWKALLHLLHLTSYEEKIQEQYQSSDNLEKRISIHSYSTNPEDWFDWVFRHMDIRKGSHILELGCGTGLLWKKNASKLAKNLSIVLTDRSEEMLKQARENLAPFTDEFKRKNIRIRYEIMDANTLELPKSAYDTIIANHMLYHVENRKECLRQVSNALKKTGVFYCSTIGDGHMRELHAIVRSFDPQIEIMHERNVVEFSLESGRQQLEPFFASIDCQKQENNLLVDKALPIYNYVYSYPGNAPYVLDKRGEEFKELLENRIQKEGAILIHKATGMFICQK